MKFFYSFFAAATLLCGYFWLTDAPGSGMGYATGFFALAGVGVVFYNYRKFGSPWRSSLSK